MGYAKPTLPRLVDQRARRRATQELMKRHRAEFDGLLAQFRLEAAAEAEELARVAAANRAQRPSPSEHHASTPEPVADDPPRLMPGARLAGQSALDRIDVARCSVCAKSHDRNHVCTKCGSLPPLTLPEQFAEVARLTDAGTDVEQVSRTLRIAPDRVLQLLDAPA